MYSKRTLQYFIFFSHGRYDIVIMHFTFIYVISSFNIPCSTGLLVMKFFQRNLKSPLSLFFCMKCVFFLTAFKSFFYTGFSNLVITFLGVVFFILLVFGVFEPLGCVGLQFSSNLENFDPLFL